MIDFCFGFDYKNAVASLFSFRRCKLQLQQVNFFVFRFLLISTKQTTTQQIIPDDAKTCFCSHFVLMFFMFFYDRAENSEHKLTYTHGEDGTHVKLVSNCR